MAPRNKNKPRPRKKVVIEYPPLTTRKWRPPLRDRPWDPFKKKVFKRKPIFPQMEKVPHSTLEKVWHRYRVLSKKCAILFGNYSQAHLRYPLKTRGKQGPANCFVAIGYSKIKEMDKWNEYSLDTILDIGNKLHHYSTILNKVTCTCATPQEVHNSFYIGDINIIMAIENDIVNGTLFDGGSGTPHLYETMKGCFTRTPYCILEIENKFVAIWKHQGPYYYFDPNDRERDTKRCREGTGVSMIVRFMTVETLVEFIWDSVEIQNENLKFTLTPIHIKKILKQNLTPPLTLEELLATVKLVPKAGGEEERPETPKTPNKKKRGEEEEKPKEPFLARFPGYEAAKKTAETAMRPPPLGKKKKPPSPPPEPEPESNTPSLSSLVDPERIEKRPLIPIEKPKAPSTTYFTSMIKDKSGILFASYHQNDPSCSRFYGKQSLANAVAAIAMLRLYKSKVWFTKILDEILLTGEQIYMDSRKNLIGDQVLGIKTLVEKFKLNRKYYKPEIEESTVIGRLNSTKFDVMDLLPALEEFFADNDTGIIRGPLLLAVWSEDGKYYMFDPNERNKNGKAFLKAMPLTLGSMTIEPEKGLACLTWFTSLEDLANLYMENVDRHLRREHFFISKIEVKDYMELPTPWNKFEPLRMGKWILRGTIAQSDTKFAPPSRNTQSTAISTLAIAYASLKNPIFWDRDTIDEIVTEGDTFYNKCVDVLKAKNKFIDRMLMMAEMITTYQLNENELHFEIDECLVNGVLNVDENNEAPNLQKGFKEFFKENDSGVVTAKNLSVAIWKDDDAYYYFDARARDTKGYNSVGGTACCIRFLTSDDLANILAANLEADKQEFFNIARVAVSIWEKTEDGVKPEFYNFTELSRKKGIIRASTHQGDKEKYDLNADKQTLPNMMIALGMSAVYPTYLWKVDTLDEILKFGDKLYEDSRAEFIKQCLEKLALSQPGTPAPATPPPEAKGKGKGKEKGSKGKAVVVEAPPKEPEPELTYDSITKDNVIKEFRLSTYKMETTFAATVDCVFEKDEKAPPTADEPPPEEEKKEDKKGKKGKKDDKKVEEKKEKIDNTLKGMLEKYLADDPKDTKDTKKLAIIESEFITVCVWKDGLCYLFDPSGKDIEGNTYGRENWSAKYIPPDLTEEEEEEEYYDYGDEAMMLQQMLAGGDTAATSVRSSKSKTAKSAKETKSAITTETESRLEPSPAPFYAEEMEEEEEEDIIQEYEKIMSEIDLSDAKACSILFTTIAELISHIIENVPPNKRDQGFKFTSVNLKVTLDTKLVTNPLNKEEGNWYGFKEIDNERWILRGAMDMHHSMYPIANRGKQYGSMCMVACCFSRLFALPKFKPITIDHILKYGDRLHTAVRKIREKELVKSSKDLGLSYNDIILILDRFSITAADALRQFYLGDYLVIVDVTKDVIVGDLTAQEKKVDPLIAALQPASTGDPSTQSLEKVLTLKRGIERFFQEYDYGVINAKEISAAIWKIHDFYYMFDPESRGPNGVQETNGTACITRFQNLEKLTETFSKNLAKKGSNAYSIDYVKIKSYEAKRPQTDVRQIIPTDPKITAFQEICPGKMILRGNFNQDNPKFNVPPNSCACPNALVALAMSQIHKTETWTKPIIDDIITNGYNLYEACVNELGYDFNAWEDKLYLDLVLPEFNIGVMQVNYELGQEGVKQGLLNIKHPTTLNLRRGCEEFFFESNHGVIQTDPLTTAIWHDNNLYYMFDPNSRSSTGLYKTGGTACLMIFKSIKYLTDHFISNVPPQLQSSQFIITPVEINLSEVKEPRSRPMRKADILKITEIDSLASDHIIIENAGGGGPGEEGGKPKHPHKKPTGPFCSCPHHPQDTIVKKPDKKACRCPNKKNKSLRPVRHTETLENILSPEQKKKWAREKSEAKKQRDIMMLLQRLRREFYPLDNGEAIVRAHYSQNSDKYSDFSRNKQALANALVAIVMSKLHEPNTWSYKNIEIILDSGDFLYKDSYTYYRPTNPYLGLKNVMRTFHLQHLKIKTVIYRPCIYGEVKYEDLYVGLLNFFMQETSGILLTESFVVAIFQKAEQYFMFDPYDRNARGFPTQEGVEGAACLLRFENVETLVEKFLKNSGADPEAEESARFSVSAVALDEVTRTS